MSEVPKVAPGPNKNESNYWATKAQNFVRKRPGMVANSGNFATPNITNQKAKGIGLVSRGKSPTAKTKRHIVKATNITFAI